MSANAVYLPVWKKNNRNFITKKIPLRQTSYHQFSPKQKLITGPQKETSWLERKKLKSFWFRKLQWTLKPTTLGSTPSIFLLRKKKNSEIVASQCHVRLRHEIFHKKNLHLVWLPPKSFFVSKNADVSCSMKSWNYSNQQNKVTKLVFKTSPQKAKKSLNTFINKLDTSWKIHEKYRILLEKHIVGHLKKSISGYTFLTSQSRHQTTSPLFFQSPPSQALHLFSCRKKKQREPIWNRYTKWWFPKMMVPPNHPCL